MAGFTQHVFDEPCCFYLPGAAVTVPGIFLLVNGFRALIAL